MHHGLGLAKIDHASGRIIANAIVAGTISELTGGKFANGAMSAAFRVAFNEMQGWYRGKTVNGELVDRDGDPKPPGNMILNKAGYWQIDGGTGNFAGAAQENAFGSRHNIDVDGSVSVGQSVTNFIGVVGISKTISSDASLSCAVSTDCVMVGIGFIATTTTVGTLKAEAVDSVSSAPVYGIFASGSVFRGAKGSINVGGLENNSASVSGGISKGFSWAVGFKRCTSTKSGSGCN